MFVSGKISAKAILENKKREIKKVYFLDGLRNKDMGYIRAIAKDLDVEYVTREFLDDIAESSSHGGVVIECGPRKNDSTNGLKRLLLLEGIRDPYHMGDILRTAFAMGLDGIVSSSYDFYDQEKTLIRASAGASEHLIWHTTNDMAKTVDALKKQGVKLYAAHRDSSAVSLPKAKLSGSVCICVGGAMRGLSTEVLERVDGYVRLDYQAKVALSAVGSASIFAYEMYRQKGE